ncbi:MAG: hypothetical protein AAB882_01920 [Patescibacteria group bacterium]
MNAITIPRSLAGNDDLVLLPRKEYENLVAHKTGSLKLTKVQKQNLEAARKGRAAGELLSYDEFIRELGPARSA